MTEPHTRSCDFKLRATEILKWVQRFCVINPGTRLPNLSAEFVRGTWVSLRAPLCVGNWHLGAE